MTPATIASHLHAKPWLIEPEALNALIARVEADIRNGYAPEQKDRPPISLIDRGQAGVAVIRVKGVMMRDAEEGAEDYGIVSTAKVQAAFEDARDDGSINQVLIHFDTPGGQVAGIYEAAQALQELTAKKTVYAYTDGLCCSAGYWLASQAQAIYATPSARVGSIGVILAFIDWKGAFDAMGLKMEVITTGKHKGAGVMGTSLTDEQRQRLQAQVDEIGADFKAAVLARGRRIPAEAMEGQTFSAKEAQRHNIAGRVSGLPEVFSRMRTLRGIDTRTGASGDASRTTPMTIEQQLSDATANVADLTAKLAEANTAAEQAKQALATETANREKAEAELQAEMEKSEATAKAKDTEITALKEKATALEAKEQDIEKRAAAKAAQIAAGSGGVPLPVGQAPDDQQRSNGPVTPLSRIAAGRAAMLGK